MPLFSGWSLRTLDSIFQKKEKKTGISNKLAGHSAVEIANALRLQLEAFWLGEPPFHAPVLKDDIMEWWMNLEQGNSPRSNVIAVNYARSQNIQNLSQQEGLLAMIMGAECPHRPPRRPAVAFRRLDQALIDKVKMKRQEEDSDASASDADSTEMDEEDDKEVEKISRGRKKNMKKTFRFDDVFVVDVVVMLRAPGMKGLLSVTDDEDLGTKESGSLQPESVAESQAADWNCGIVSGPYPVYLLRELTRDSADPYYRV
ncbi:hypothetical protein FB451DRAFT_1180114 [Mycena latifolia]|nr:hypothetical protein FB451DRAFT_1180114 [Mycena latifolia]